MMRRTEKGVNEAGRWGGWKCSAQGANSFQNYVKKEEACSPKVS